MLWKLQCVLVEYQMLDGTEMSMQYYQYTLYCMQDRLICLSHITSSLHIFAVCDVSLRHGYADLFLKFKFLVRQ